MSFLKKLVGKSPVGKLVSKTDPVARKVMGGNAKPSGLGQGTPTAMGTRLGPASPTGDAGARSGVGRLRQNQRELKSRNVLK